MLLNGQYEKCTFSRTGSITVLSGTLRNTLETPFWVATRRLITTVLVNHSWSFRWLRDDQQASYTVCTHPFSLVSSLTIWITITKQEGRKVENKTNIYKREWMGRREIESNEWSSRRKRGSSDGREGRKEILSRAEHVGGSLIRTYQPKAVEGVSNQARSTLTKPSPNPPNHPTNPAKP